MSKAVFKALILAALVVVMTSSPVDYATFLSNSVCLPFQRLTSIVTLTFNAVVDVVVLPVTFVIELIIKAICWLEDQYLLLATKSLNIFDRCIRTITEMLRFVVNFVVTVFTVPISMINQVTLLIFQNNNAAEKFYTSSIDQISSSTSVFVDLILYFVSDVIIQTWLKSGVALLIRGTGWLIEAPFYLLQNVLATAVKILKYLFALPFELILAGLNYLVYTSLYPYVYMAYSAIGTGLVALILPELIRNNNIRMDDLRNVLKNAGYASQFPRDNIGESNVSIADDVRTLLDFLEAREESKTECVVCFEDKEPVTLRPCGHNNVCRECVNQIQNMNNRCPVCRENIHT